VSKAKKPKKCVACKLRPGVRECDWKIAKRGNKDVTCDAPLCESCTFSPAPEKDLCPLHKDKYKCWVIERGKKNATDDNSGK
jgi:hypothetical protein